MPNKRFNLVFFVLVLAALACNISVQNSAAPATVSVEDAKTTAVAAFLTQQGPPTAEIPAATATKAPVVDVPPTKSSKLKPTAQPTADIQSLIQNAKILVYEDAASNYQLDPWVQLTLNKMKLKYVHVGDAIGTFMSNLNSSTQWDLIIVAGESRKGVQGEFWDVITPKVTTGKTALILETWYLSQIGNGRIKALTDACGVTFQSTRRLVDSVYILDDSNPVFSTPNSGFSLTSYVGYWKDKGGDYVRLTGGGDATLLAGGSASEKSRNGLMTSCLGGRVIIQTFSTHDYRRETMQMLWENYIINVLTNHFKALP